MEVTLKDDSGFPKEGEVKVRCESKSEALQQAKALINENKGKGKKVNVYFFHTDPVDTHVA